jgi:hypothetical protein
MRPGHRRPFCCWGGRAAIAKGKLAQQGHTFQAPAMFVVTEAEAAAIRAVFEQEGELSAAIELRRRIEVGLALEPCLALRQDVGVILLAGMRGLFLA